MHFRLLSLLLSFFFHLGFFFLVFTLTFFFLFLFTLVFFFWLFLAFFFSLPFLYISFIFFLILIQTVKQSMEILGFLLLIFFLLLVQMVFLCLLVKVFKKQQLGILWHKFLNMPIGLLKIVIKLHQIIIIIYYHNPVFIGQLLLNLEISSHLQVTCKNLLYRLFSRQQVLMEELSNFNLKLFQLLSRSI